ncbi:MAG: class I SAM-dependent methyltransferase [Candidatus Bathyarchaeota archaeon]|nr:class I SAM-dependent methyltransferase [Candidatus Bathyarchaeota archaeon]
MNSEWCQKRKVIQSYDATAYLYDMRYAEEQKAKFEAALRNTKFFEQNRILDLGCGTGLLFDYIISKAEILVGLDISKRILTEAKRKYGKFGNVYLVLADADYAPFKDGVFTHVFAVTILQNMPSPEKTIVETKRVTVKNAIIVFTGLKKKFSVELLEALLRRSGLKMIGIMDEVNLKCYVAICENNVPNSIHQR